jgi:hypothetical protein
VDGRLTPGRRVFGLVSDGYLAPMTTTPSEPDEEPREDEADEVPEEGAEEGEPIEPPD